MRKDGQITVFLSLVLVCVFGLLCGILESARTAGARCYLQTAWDSSVQSVFSQYHRGLWERYRILGLECGDTEAVEQEAASFLVPYLQAKQFYPMELEQTETVSTLYLTDNGGSYLKQEIMDYMKYGIWEFDFNPEEADSIFAGVKELIGADQMSSGWEEHTKEAMRVERALEDIMNSLETRAELKREAERSLKENHGSAFRRKAASLIKEIRRMPKLVKTYENRADQWGSVLENTREEMASVKADMGQAAWSAYEEEMEACREYTDADGIRRLEVTALSEETEQIVAQVEKLVKEAEDIEDYINDWEPEDEDDELDEDALWEPLRDSFGRLTWKTLSCNMGVQDKESQGFLEQITSMAKLDIMKLVLPEGTEVSRAVLPLEHCPSGLQTQEENGSTSLLERIIVDEYCAKVFRNFLTPGGEGVLYEMEYLIGKEATDAGNLEAVILRLLAIREGANLVYLLANTGKRNEAQTLAAAIVGTVGLTPLIPVVTFFILSVWALGEALRDIKSLLGGSKVPLFKTDKSWSLDLQGLLDMGRNTTVVSGTDTGEGLDYEGYLKLLLFMENPVKKYYKMMDVMQMNLRKQQSDFLMTDCLYGVDINAAVCGKHVFLSMGLWKNEEQLPAMTYKTQINTRKAYGKT